MWLRVATHYRNSYERCSIRHISEPSRTAVGRLSGRRSATSQDLVRGLPSRASAQTGVFVGGHWAGRRLHAGGAGLAGNGRRKTDYFRSACAADRHCGNILFVGDEPRTPIPRLIWASFTAPAREREKPGPSALGELEFEIAASIGLSMVQGFVCLASGPRRCGLRTPPG